MKVFCKKLIICLLVFVLLFNFTFQPKVQANTDVASAVGNILDKVGGMADGIAGLMTWVYRLLVMTAEAALIGLMSSIASTFGYVNAYGEIKDDVEVGLFTPDDIFFNKLLLTDANVFKMQPEMPDTILNMRSNIALWYLIMRIIAISILLGILVFIAIRMAISVVASEKAKYKEMLVNWTMSIGLVFILHYVIIGGCALNSALVEIFAKIFENTSSLEEGIGTLLANALSPSFVGGWAALIVVAMITVQTLAFLVYYIKRMLTISFLAIISPLITITYSIDKLGDGKAQALSAWMKEFFFTIVIQPFHCVIYMVFMSMAISAFNPVTKAGDVFNVFGSGFGIDKLIGGILAILCIKFIWDAEKIIKNIFGIKVSESLGDAVASAAVAGAVVSKTMGMAKGAAGAAKNAKQLAVKSGLADKFKGLNYEGRSNKKIEKWQKKKDAAKAAGNMDKVKKYNNKIADRGVKVEAMKMGYGVRGKTYKAGQKIKGATGFVKSKSDKVKNKVGEFMNTGTGQFLKRHVSNSAGIAAAVMGASMTYGASDKTSLFEAGIAGYGVYGGVKNGVMNLMNRKNDNYIDQSTQYAKMLCKVEGDDPDKMTNEDMARKMKMATVNDKNGDYKKISDKRKDAKEDVAKQLEARDRANGMSEEDIADKVAQKEYIKTADKAMEDIDTGVYFGDLDLDKIAATINLDPSIFKDAVGDYSKDSIGKKMAELNSTMDTLGGWDGYHAAVLDEHVGKEVKIIEETEEIEETPTPAPTPNPNPPETVTPADFAKELNQYNNSSDQNDSNLNEILSIVKGISSDFESAINELKKEIDKSIKVSGYDFERDEILEKIKNNNLNHSGQININEIVEEITKNIQLNNTEKTKVTTYVTRIVKQEKFNEVMKKLNKNVVDN